MRLPITYQTFCLTRIASAVLPLLLMAVMRITCLLCCWVPAHEFEYLFAECMHLTLTPTPTHHSIFSTKNFLIFSLSPLPFGALPIAEAPRRARPLLSRIKHFHCVGCRAEEKRVIANTPAHSEGIIKFVFNSSMILDFT